MAPYYPLFVRRSDGKVEVKGRGKMERNEPMPAQLDSTPNAQGVSDFYRQCFPGETKEVDWRRKLGGMLIREIGASEPKDRNFILANLPENYRLYEHVKSKSSAEGSTEKVKTHAAGGNERQDAYLYGHPGGRKKRFRSPAEFFPHLLWLTTDESGDPNNCSCRLCSPEELETDEKAKAPEEKLKQEPPTRQDSTSKANTTSAPTAAKPVRRTSQQGTSQPQPNQPTPLPRIRSTAQKQDAQYHDFYYRSGEIVWFARGSAWGLGVITKRDKLQGYSRRYHIQPLSHPLFYPPVLACMQEHLRPWLAWSPPPCTTQELNPHTGNNFKVYTYNTVDWNSVVNQRWGPGDGEVDGSILAVKMVETTLTLFDVIDSRTSDPSNRQASEILYNGIFLGGEKIWVGDPIRLRNSQLQTDIMVLQQIIERQNPQDPDRPYVTFVGDTFTMRVVQFEPESVPKDDSYLPQRVREDLNWRNSITASNPNPQRRHTYYWRLSNKQAKVRIEDVKGRWYESSIFTPIIDGQQFQIDRAAGEVKDAGLYMNGQGDCNKTLQGRSFRPADLKTRKREDAFGKAVPPNMKISKDNEEAKDSSTQLAPAPPPSREVKMLDRANTPLSRQGQSYQSQSQPPPQSQQQLKQSQQTLRDQVASPQERQPQSPSEPQFLQDQLHEQAMQGRLVYGNDVGQATESQFDQFMSTEDDTEIPGFGHSYTTHQLDDMFSRPE